MHEYVCASVYIRLSLTLCVGLIFLFKYQASPLNPSTQTLITPEDHRSEQIYFARQMITNACGTQAILNLILNLDDQTTVDHGITLGEELKNFKEFTRFLPPDMRGEAISNSDLIRKAHNGFARPEPFIFEEKKSRDESGGEDAFHFIGYVPIGGKLYELDGLKPGPILLHTDGEVTRENWMAAARTAIQARLQHYASKEIRFNLMALIGNQADQIKQKIDAVEKQIAAAKGTSSIASTAGDAASAASAMDTDTSASVSVLEEEHAHLKRQLEDEQHKMERWKVENLRRKHNYVRVHTCCKLSLIWFHVPM
jgi:ubiquitin carboxyl-terminal hydrolase L5